jgi:hypothetical protein
MLGFDERGETMLSAAASHLVVTQLVAARRILAVVLAQRLLPFAACLAVRPGAASVSWRLTWIAAWAAAVAIARGPGAGRSLILVAIGALYSFVLSLGVNHLSRWLAEGHVTEPTCTFSSF